MTREKYVKMYERFYQSVANACKSDEFFQRVIYPFSLLPPSKLHDILGEVKKAIQITNPDYDIVIKRLHLYYEMKLVTFRIDAD